MKEFIEIPFGAKDSELEGWEYTIPEGFVASIENGKIIVKKEDDRDEKIRKEILEYFQQFENEELRGVNISDWIAWLEKQGEQKEPTYKDLQEAAIRIADDILPIAGREIWHGETEENVKIRNLIREGVKRGANWHNEHIMTSAWTKDDEENLNQLHKLIVKKAYEEYEIDTEDETLWGKHAILDNWLKSLKDRFQSHWKPSEEQMTHLVAAIEESNGNCILQSLYNDLKKL